MKRTTKFTLAGLAIAMLSTASLVACSQAPAGATALPEGCAYEDAVLHCEGVDLEEILSSKGAASAVALSMSGGILGKETSLSGLENLGDLFVADPVDPESIARVAETAVSLDKLAISSPVPSDMDIATPTVIIGFIGESAGGELFERAPIQKMDPKFAPTTLISTKLYELSPASSAKLEGLNVTGAIGGKIIDLSGYTSLKELNITAEKGTGFVLPKHLSKDDLTITKDSSGTTYEF